ncbi:histidine phosphatase family protein [Streptomyces sp. NPDC059785]|uniref:histidine phosphatase family protein n=1 Tax=unclassified Streptomyces TaxID=2593676 RepID=UPI00366114E2
MPTEICLIRHAAYERFDERRSADGRWDPPLSEEGAAQAEALAGRLAAFGWDHLLSSPLLRARGTAEKIATACGLTAEQRLSWAEFFKGTLEGISPPDAVSDTHDDHWRNGAWRAWPGGETRVAFRARVLDALRACPQGARTLVVTHGGVINEVLCALLDSPPRTVFRIDLTGVTRVGRKGDHASVACVNDTWHLEDSLSMPLTVLASKGKV